MTSPLVDEMVDLLAMSLIYVEEASDDPTNDHGTAKDLAKRIRALLERLETAD